MSNPRIPFQLAGARPRLAAPGGGRLIVHLVVNVEHWRFDAPMPRRVLPAPHGDERLPDVPNFAWCEYGLRCGLPRILSLLAERGVVAGASVNASLIDAYPAAAEAMHEAGWEFIGHGYEQRSLQGEADENAAIRAALDRLRAFTGKPVRGWLSPGLRESAHTPDILKAAGVDYVCDWVLDDLPCWMTTRYGPLIAMPYSVELNDVVVYGVEHHDAAELERRLSDTLVAFEDELEAQPKVLTIGLHPHLIGVPHRIGTLGHMLDLLMARTDTVFMTGSRIADWYAAAEPAPA
jgi:allantoinase